MSSGMGKNWQKPGCLVFFKTTARRLVLTRLAATIFRVFLFFWRLGTLVLFLTFWQDSAGLSTGQMQTCSGRKKSA